ncbi:hypothetical protein T439DRAFT_304201 [Meredithblackwellia eburnea MCA 4105]
MTSRMSHETANEPASSSLEKGQPQQQQWTPENHQGGAFLRTNITPGGHTIDNSQPSFPVYHRRFANPAPLGLSAFALTTFVLSLINVKTNNVTVPNVVVGLALAYGGLVQLLAGMWEFACGNTFGATAFSSYGGFWISFAFLISPWSGIEDSYTNKDDFAHGVGFYLFGWFIFTFLMLIGALRSSVALAGVFFFLTITFLLLGISYFVPSHPGIAVAGGAFGLITAFNAWYVALTGLLTPDTSYFVLPTGDLSKRD